MAAAADIKKFKAFELVLANNIETISRISLVEKRTNASIDTAAVKNHIIGD